MFSSRESGGEFLPFLAVSKGKKLFARLLPFLKHHKALTVLRVVTKNLPTLMSRDAEEVAACAVWNVCFSPILSVWGRWTLVLSEGEILAQCRAHKNLFYKCTLFFSFFLPTNKALPVLYPSLRNVIGGLTFSQLINVLKDLTSVTSYESLTLACQNKVYSCSSQPFFFFLNHVGNFFFLCGAS